MPLNWLQFWETLSEKETFPNTSHKVSWSVEQLEGYTDRSRFQWCSCSFYYLFDLHFEGVVSNSGGLGTAWLLKGSCIWTTSQLVFSVTLQLHGLGMAWKNLPLALCTSWSFSYLEVLKPFTDLSQVPKPFSPSAFLHDFLRRQHSLASCRISLLSFALSGTVVLLGMSPNWLSPST